jgi:hypothetical protein
VDVGRRAARGECRYCCNSEAGDLTLPAVSFQVKSRTGEWVSFEGRLDLGSDALLLPESDAQLLSVLPWEATFVTVETTGGANQGRMVEMEAELAGTRFVTPVVFVNGGSAFERLLGVDPLLQTFELRISKDVVNFVPLDSPRTDAFMIRTL